jgi:hypothetical protein
VVEDQVVGRDQSGDQRRRGKLLMTGQPNAPHDSRILRT